MVYIAAASQKLQVRTYLLSLYGKSAAGAWSGEGFLAGSKKNFKMPPLGRKRL